MKKILFLIAAVAMMAMPSCNEKPSKTANESTTATVEQSGNVTNQDSMPKVDVERAKPTDDGKDHTVAEFKTKEYQVKLENLADGTYRLTLGDKNSSNQTVETKECVMQGGNYLMKADDGKIYIIAAKDGGQQLTIMTEKEILYNGKAGE